MKVKYCCTELERLMNDEVELCEDVIYATGDNCTTAFNFCPYCGAEIKIICKPKED